VRRNLCAEAIRLAEMLTTLMPDQTEARALLALMLLIDSRRDTRQTPDGDLVLLEDQDRSRWDRAQIERGLALAESALRAQRIGAYAIQAGIAAEHARAIDASRTNWSRIAALYSALLAINPNPVIELNRAVAIAMAEGPARGLSLIEKIEAGGELADYHLMWSAKADLLRRLGDHAKAAEAYRRALQIVKSGPERRFLERRLAQVKGAVH